MKKIKDLVSFFYPLMLEARKGKVNPYLEVMKYKGKNILNSQTVNYSYGGLHTIFNELFEKIKLQKYTFKNILVLGMGAGSVISLLRDKYKIDCNITAIEKDEVVIELAKKYFNVDRFKSLTIVHEDAYTYTTQTRERYDLIISDLFIDGDVPEIFASKKYLLNLRRIAENNCCIIYNKMTDKPIHKNEFISLFENFEQIFPGAVAHQFVAHGTENSLLYYEH